MTNSDLLEQLHEHLNSNNIAWLFGAGISNDAKIPLMNELTREIKETLKSNQVFQTVLHGLKDDETIETILDHLIDMSAIASRKKEEERKSVFDDLHKRILDSIEEIISKAQRQASIDSHRKFVNACFKWKQGRHSKAMNFFTTNYDTLLERAFALESVTYSDGFVGGEIAFFDDKDGWRRKDNANLFKLHGSIDWYLLNKQIFRGRKESLEYLESFKQNTLLIHPQASKYYETTHAPFSKQFDHFREFLRASTDNPVLVICGYGFGDGHINNEIMQASKQMTLIAFVKEKTDKFKDIEEHFGERLWLVTKEGVTNQKTDTEFSDGRDDAWTFAGLTRLLEDGTE